MPTAIQLHARLLETFRKNLARFVPQFEEPLTLCWELMALGERLHEAEREAGTTYRNADVILWGTAARGTKTYRSVLFLCSLGYGTQAVMLNRSLLEDALTARWAELNRGDAMKRIELHERHNKHLWVEILKGRQLDPGDLGNLPPLSDEQLAEMNKDFGPHGTRPWTGHRNTIELVKELDADWGDVEDRYLLAHIHSIHLRVCNLTLHNTASSIPLPVDTPKGSVYSAAESADDIAAALTTAFWAYGNLFRVTLTGDRRTQFEGSYSQNMSRFLSTETDPP